MAMTCALCTKALLFFPPDVRALFKNGYNASTGYLFVNPRLTTNRPYTRKPLAG
jgi:hypothetical protein